MKLQILRVKKNNIHTFDVHLHSIYIINRSNHSLIFIYCFPRNVNDTIKLRRQV
jgi:hypothetical protein